MSLLTFMNTQSQKSNACMTESTGLFIFNRTLVYSLRITCTDQSHDLTCGRFSLQWSLQSVICRWSLAVSDQSSMRALVPNARNTRKGTTLINKLCRINDGGCGPLSNLCVGAGVPVRVVDYYSVGSSQINAQTPDFSGQQEDKN